VSARALLRAAIVACTAVLPACGGAECDPIDFVFGCGQDEADEEAMPPDVRISLPSSTGSFFTSSEQVRIAGTTSDANARIYWSHSAEARDVAQGETSPDGDLCFFDCEYDWSVNVSLGVGYNLITVVAAGDGGTTTTAIAITRQAPQPQWSWVR
jgi:hypothetical protein